MLGRKSPSRTLDGHIARNRALLERFAALGADRFAKRSIDLFFYTPGESEAEQLSADLRGDGFSRVVVSRREEMCSVHAQLEASITEVASVAFVERYVELAEKHGAEFDGWGASVDGPAA